MYDRHALTTTAIALRVKRRISWLSGKTEPTRGNKALWNSTVFPLIATPRVIRRYLTFWESFTPSRLRFIWILCIGGSSILAISSFTVDLPLLLRVMYWI
jgi:hypothetical protein